MRRIRRMSDAVWATADLLVGTENITAAVLKAEAGLDDAAANGARKRLLTSLDKPASRRVSRRSSASSSVSP